MAMEPQSTQDATQHAMQVLDAKYSKADLQPVVRDNCKHLSANQQKKLLQLLKKYELLFDGTLGDWKTKLVSFQLKEGVSPYHSQAFSVPKTLKETLIKEVSSSLGNKTVAGNNKSCISSASFGIQII